MLIDQMKLRHQTQPCPVSCMTASIAMVVDRPVAWIKNLFHERYRNGGLSIRQMLTELGVPFKSFDSADSNSLGKSGIYLVSVPSLNIVGGMHQVVIEVQDVDWHVHDPAWGLEVDGKQRKYYVAWVARPDVPNEVQMTSGYTIDAFIEFEDLPQFK